MRDGRIVKLLTLIFVLMFVTGCGYSPEDRALKKQIEKQGEENAINYIEKKYGFTPKVTSSKANELPAAVFKTTFSTDGMVYVDMKYGEKEFLVYINGESVVEEGYDTYQADQIKADIRSEIEELLGTDVIDFEMWLRSETDASVLGSKINHNGLNTFYDGTKEVLKDILGGTYDRNSVTIYLSEYDLKNIDSDMIGENFGDNTDFLFINCKSAGMRENIDNLGLGEYKGHSWEEMDVYSIYIKDFLSICADEKEYVEYKAEQLGDITYVTSGGTYCNIKETDEMDDISNWNVLNIWAANYEDAKRVYKIYDLETDADTVTFFVSTDKIENYKKLEGLSFVIQANGDEEVDYDRINTEVISDGKYLAGVLDTDSGYETYKVSIFAEGAK